MSTQTARAAGTRHSIAALAETGGPHDALRQALADLGLPAGCAMDRLVAELASCDASPIGTAAHDGLERRLVGWVEDLLQRPLGSPREAVAAARAAVLLSDAAARWPEAFLAEEAPQELKVAMAKAFPQAVPEARPLAMPAQSLAPAELPRLLPTLRPARITRRA